MIPAEGGNALTTSSCIHAVAAMLLRQSSAIAMARVRAKSAISMFIIEQPRRRVRSSMIDSDTLKRTCRSLLMVTKISKLAGLTKTSAICASLEHDAGAAISSRLTCI